MPRSFAYEFSTTGTPEETQERLQRVLNERLRRPGGGGAASNLHREMRLGRHTPTSLTYKPALRVPLPVSISVWLGRVLNGERVNVTFDSNASDGETRVVVSGKVGRGGEAVAERDFWGEALAASKWR